MEQPSSLSKTQELVAVPVRLCDDILALLAEVRVALSELAQDDTSGDECMDEDDMFDDVPRTPAVVRTPKRAQSWLNSVQSARSATATNSSVHPR